ncbi:MAG: response regulator transcription factor [Bacillota bacterium]
MKIAVVDDEALMRKLIGLYLRADFTVIEATNGWEALELFHTEQPDLVLLDVMMPKLDGWETLKRIRSLSPVPVVMLTARGEVADRIEGLNLGADDYIAKPFDGNELVARIQAVLRRSRPPAGAEEIIAGDLVIHPGERTATWKGQSLTLTLKEFDLLVLLANHPGQTFTRDRLLNRVWGADYDGGTRTVDSHIKNLREKLGDGGRLIITAWGVGYRFADVVREAQ